MLEVYQGLFNTAFDYIPLGLARPLAWSLRPTYMAHTFYIAFPPHQ